MKKSLLILSIVFTIISAFLMIYPTMFFSLFLQGHGNGETGTEILGFFFFVLFDIFAFVGSLVSFVLNLVHFIKCKKPVVIVLFIIAILILLATIGMFITVMILM